MKWYWWLLIVLLSCGFILVYLYFVGKRAKNDQLAKAREAKADKNKFINLDDVSASELRETVTMSE